MSSFSITIFILVVIFIQASFAPMLFHGLVQPDLILTSIAIAALLFDKKESFCHSNGRRAHSGHYHWQLFWPSFTAILIDNSASGQIWKRKIYTPLVYIFACCCYGNDCVLAVLQFDFVVGRKSLSFLFLLLESRYSADFLKWSFVYNPL